MSTLWGSTAAIFAMRIAPDGQTVVTGGGESSVRLWDLRTASCVRTMGQYTTQVRLCCTAYRHGSFARNNDLCWN